MKPKQISLASVVVQGKQTLSSTVDDETVLLSIRNSKYYGLDAIASRIWRLTAHPIKVADIVRILQHEYNVEEDRCTHDVTTLLQELCAENLIFLKDEVPA